MLKMTNNVRTQIGSYRNSGFSLIELMIVVAIVAILASIALPAYNDHVRKTRRTAGAACASAAAQQMERFYTTALRYNGTGSPTAAQLSAICEPKTLAFYTPSVATPDAKSYTITMSPTGEQSGDSCGDLSINQAGTKSPTTPSCW